VKKLHADAVIPKYQSRLASGFDVHSLEEVAIYPGETLAIRTGLAMDVGVGYELQIRPNPGLSLKSPLRVANAPGTVDADYRGEILILLTNTACPAKHANGRTAYTISKGERIAQGVLCPVVHQADVEVTDYLSPSGRFDGESGGKGG
jgi:dUTP pyrophosphatase